MGGVKGEIITPARAKPPCSALLSFFFQSIVVAPQKVSLRFVWHACQGKRQEHLPVEVCPQCSPVLLLPLPQEATAQGDAQEISLFQAIQDLQ